MESNQSKKSENEDSHEEIKQQIEEMKEVIKK